MDARERLRLYLEQRRELGESEFVLDGMPVEDVLKIIGDKNPAPARKAPASSGGPARQPSARDAAPAAGGDWRETLKAIGANDAAPKPASVPKAAAVANSAAAPEAAVPPKAASAPSGKQLSASVVNSPVPPTPNPTEGIVVGSANREPMTGPMAALDSLEAVAKHIAGCKACALGATAKNHVPGEGNPHAGFVVVGEAPGEKEDELGRPFVGRSGDLLTKILEAVQFKREDVFICNVLKHRPPGNRNPTTPEIAACSPYLLRQLELLQPKVILALGTFAAQTLLQSTLPIGKLRGPVHRFHGIPLIVTYHPAALLRNPAYKRPTWDDVQLARRIFDSSSQA